MKKFLRTPLGLATIAVAVIAVVLTFVLVGIGGADKTPKEKLVSTVGLKYGECFQSTQLDSRSVTPVDCKVKHDAQVVAASSVSTFFSTYDSVALDVEAERLCSEEAFRFIHESWLSFNFTPTKITPTQSEWSAGSHVVQCAIVDPNANLHQSLHDIVAGATPTGK
jgi:hypothetical protein